VPGFIVNRVARPYYAEGFAALGEGIDPAIIDHALTGAGGFRMGPLALADLIGHDVNYAVARSVYDAYDGRTRFRPQTSQQALFDAGTFGRKTGSGVYDYAGEPPEPPLLRGAEKSTDLTIGNGTVLLMPLVEAARSVGLAVGESPAVSAEILRINGTTAALGDGRTLAERPDVDVLIDHARDFGTASLLVVTTRNAAAASRIAGFTAAIGKSAVALPDRPGQIVLRTLAQLANAAADAVTDQVASAEGIDEAMRFGANHPEGPLGWANRIGTERVSAALDHIRAATGDPLYAPARFPARAGASENG
jgi:3-hydroxybutyryl-CoA dehydrogenase